MVRISVLNWFCFLGFCEKRCKKRHFIVPRSDIFAIFQNTDAAGIIEFNVCEVFQANHYLIKVVKIKNDLNQIVFDSTKFVIKLFKLQSTTFEPLEISTVTVGDVVIIKDAEDQCWKRGQVLFSDTERVQILFIGKFRTKYSLKIYFKFYIASNFFFCQIASIFKL